MKNQTCIFGESAAVEAIISSTSHIIDKYRNLIVYKYSGKDPRVLRLILDARMRNLNENCILQRHWQRMTRNPNKARHHDSIALREKYVTCQYHRYYLSKPTTERKN